VSIGQRFAEAFKPHFGARRARSPRPFTAIEQYPAAMTMLDIALAPAAGGFFKAKSDLRWLEAGRWASRSSPTPSVYPDIEDGERQSTGFVHA
jgi:hypothetical protein